MAGEWLKLEAATPDKPEVLALTVRMGWDDPDLTVGKLFRLWRWFDQQTTDGNARGVTPALLDRQVGVSGFIQAVAEVGWLSINADGVSLTNFDRHNGKTAKERALTAKRVANHKANASANGEGNAPTVSAPLAREEKRREEQKDSSSADAESAKPAKRKSKIPDDFHPDETGQRNCAEAGFVLADELAKFRNHHEAQGTVMSNWQAGFRTWIDKAKSFRKPWQAPQSVTVPSAPGRDPALKKLDEDAKKAAPIPPQVRAQIDAALKGKVH